MELELTHIDKNGAARMVDVGGKGITRREAVATGWIQLKPETLQLILEDGIKKGNVLAVARVAGIMGAKNTSTLIPMCHNVPIDGVTVDLTPCKEDSRVYIEATARCTHKTGIEMEALTAVSVAALTIYDMVKAVDKSMVIGDITLVKKTGGKSDINLMKENANG